MIKLCCKLSLQQWWRRLAMAKLLSLEISLHVPRCLVSCCNLTHHVTWHTVESFQPRSSLLNKTRGLLTSLLTYWVSVEFLSCHLFMTTLTVSYYYGSCTQASFHCAFRRPVIYNLTGCCSRTDHLLPVSATHSSLTLSLAANHSSLLARLQIISKNDLLLLFWHNFCPGQNISVRTVVSL